MLAPSPPPLKVWLRPCLIARVKNIRTGVIKYKTYITTTSFSTNCIFLKYQKLNLCCTYKTIFEINYLDYTNIHYFMGSAGP